MQQKQIALQEIIWEITGKCNNGCTYCGSKHIRSAAPNTDIILEIARKIAAYPPKEINISGGDPICVEPEVHADVLKILRGSDRPPVCKIIVNPKSFIRYQKKFNDIVEMYDWAGISVNDQEEIDAMVEYKKTIDVFDEFTVITNFNLLNIFMFDAIRRVVGNNIWQIQFTIDDKQGIYNSPEAVRYLQEKISNSNAKIVIADNMNGGQCSAGKCSLGILHTGDVVGCLSMRSWENSLSIEGNIARDLSLKDIWERSFIRYRFSEFKCCKDVCNNCKISPPAIDWNTPRASVTTYPEATVDKDGKIILNTPGKTIDYPEKPKKPIVAMYAVFPGPGDTGNPPSGMGDVMMYAVTSPTYVYGAFRAETDSSTSSTKPIFSSLNPAPTKKPKK